MLEVNFKGVKYCRLLSNTVRLEETNYLKEKFDYSFIVSYNSIIEDDAFTISDKNTCLFDLNLSNEELVHNFNATGRNEFRRTFRTLGLEFHFGYENQDAYYQFYSNCERARNWYPVPEIELNNCLVFSASFQGELISGMSCYTGLDTLRVSRIYSSKRINTNPLINGTIYGGAAKRLVVEICEYARKNGFKLVDLGGVDLKTSNKSGISEFKKSLGGNIVPVKIGRYMKNGFLQKQKEFLEKGIDIT